MFLKKITIHVSKNYVQGWSLQSFFNTEIFEGNNWDWLNIICMYL